MGSRISWPFQMVQIEMLGRSASLPGKWHTGSEGVEAVLTTAEMAARIPKSMEAQIHTIVATYSSLTIKVLSR